MLMMPNMMTRVGLSILMHIARQKRKNRSIMDLLARRRARQRITSTKQKN